jgi:integrase
MASVSRDKSGTKRVLFTDGDGERRSVRLGRASVKAAESFRLRVEALLSAKQLHQSPDAELSAWLRDLPERMFARLARVGLVESRAKAAVVTLRMLLDRFDAAASVKESTKAAYKQTTDSLRASLGEETPLGSITPAHADTWRKAIAEPVTVKGEDGQETTKQLAPATVAKRVHVARAIFKRAVRWGLIASNPFAELRAGSQSNPDRAFYVTVESIRSILAACPDDQWRAVVALSRFAGLRCPSEVAALRWGDVNWERGRLMVRSPKTAGHEGHAVRPVPIAPELRPILQDLFDRAEVGVEAVVPRLRNKGTATNLRTTFGKIIAKAGVKPWPRLFHNMRASCATDWVERFPAHVVAGWLGHSPLIAARHYLQTRDAHFEMATRGAGGGVVPVGSETGDEKSGAKSGAPEAQKAAQHPSASVRGDSRDSSESPCFAGVSQADATEREGTAKPESGRYWTRTSDLFHVKEAR